MDTTNLEELKNEMYLQSLKSQIATLENGFHNVSFFINLLMSNGALEKCHADTLMLIISQSLERQREIIQFNSDTL